MNNSSSVAVVRLSGELDAARRSEVQDALQFTGDQTALLIDLFEVTYADSTILAELLRMNEQARERGIRLALLIGSRQFMRLIQFAGLADTFRIFEERGPALVYLSSAP